MSHSERYGIMALLLLGGFVLFMLAVEVRDVTIWLPLS